MSYTTDWTLESGPPEAPDVTTCSIDYSFRFGTPDSWTDPGDPPEAEIEKVTYAVVNPAAKYGYDFFELSLTHAEQERFMAWLMENPPEPPSYEDDY